MNAQKASDDVTLKPAPEKATTAIREDLAIVFVDMDNSSSLVSKVGDLEFLRMGQEFRQRVTNLLPDYHGKAMKWTGDGFVGVFQDPREAFDFVSRFMQSLHDEPIAPAIEANERNAPPLSIRASIHVAEVLLAKTSYGEEMLGAGVNYAARITSIANPGEAIVSRSARESLREDQAARLGPPERFNVKNVESEVFRLQPRGQE